MSEVHPILVVEDSVTQMLRLRIVLEAEGFTVATATDGQEALEWLRENTARLVLSDVMMPRMTGFELCAAVKDDADLCDTPVILLTTMTSPSDIVRGLESGADSFIGKPYDPPALVKHARRILAQREYSSSSAARPGIQIQFGGRKHFLDGNRAQIIDMLLSSFGSAIDHNNRLVQRNRDLEGALARIHELESNHRAILESSIDAILVVDLQGHVRYANGSAVALLGVPRRSLIASPSPLPTTTGEVTEITLHNGDRELILEVRACEIRSESKPARLVTARDVTELVQARRTLEEASRRDPLTGLFNRRGFESAAVPALEQAARDSAPSTLLFVDLDDMKAINDDHGHDAGDAALQTIAGLLLRAAGEQNLVARLGGDEFAMLLPELGEDEATAIIRGIQRKLRRFNDARRVGWRLAASVGHATVHAIDTGTPAERLEQLFKQADAAMYVVKSQKPGRRRTP